MNQYQKEKIGEWLLNIIVVLFGMALIYMAFKTPVLIELIKSL